MIREYRTVEEIASPLMIVRMVEGVTYDELVEVELHDGSVRRGQVLEVNGDTAVVQLFESAAGSQNTYIWKMLVARTNPSIENEKSDKNA